MSPTILNKILKTKSDSPYPKDFQLLLDKMYSSNVNHIDEEFLWRAYQFSKKAHQGQMRRSGDPYFIHCINVAYILAEMHMDTITVAAGLLHDVVEDTSYTLEDVAKEFNQDVADLVDGVTKLSNIRYRTDTDRQAVNIRKMLLSVAKDIRVIIIKFADRLHNMRTLHYLPGDKQRRIARETRDVYVPLAHRLGMYRLKSEMEDLVFNILEPKASRELRKTVPKRQKFFEQYVDKFLVPIQERLREAGINAVYKRRFKSYASIHRKMVMQQRPLEDIYDIYAVRIIVDKVEECYSALGFVHQFYPPIPERFKDFIAQPKVNGYQSIHTTVVGPGGLPVEVQIRTKEMDHTAEEGVAAHWRYKETGGKVVDGDDLDAHVAWLRNLVEVLQNDDTASSHQFMEMLKIDLYKNEIFVFTPKGEVRILPVGATPLDFAFDIHTQVGLHCIGAKVNGRIVPLNTVLRSGDSVEIITSEKQTPNSAWLKVVKTSKAKSNIRKWIKKQQFEESVKLGREILEKQLRRYNKLKAYRALKDPWTKLGYESEEKMLASIGAGHRTVGKVLSALFPEDKGLGAVQPPPQPESFLRRARRSSRGVLIHGINNMMISFGKCCNPIPGDSVIGFITRGRGITVHRKDCDTLAAGLAEKDRLIDVEWDVGRSQTFLVRLRILCQERKHLLRDVTEKISALDINIDSIQMKVEDDLVAGSVIVQVDGVRQLERLRKRLLQVEGVLSVERE